MMGRSAAKRRRAGLMNDVDLFDLIKGAFIEEGYNESDALAFMVEANQEYLAELDRELTMLGVAGAAAVPAIAKRLFGKKVEKKIVRTDILKNKSRIDGRSLTDVRQINCEVGVLPRTHGSALFTRGETQALVTLTLGTSEDEQRVEILS